MTFSRFPNSLDSFSFFFFHLFCLQSLTSDILLEVQVIFPSFMPKLCVTQTCSYSFLLGACILCTCFCLSYYNDAVTKGNAFVDLFLYRQLQVVLLLSCILAFFLNYSIFLNTTLNSALTQTICGNLKVCHPRLFLMACTISQM